MKINKHTQNGITLVALVVTIVVLIILAAISLSLVLGNNGIVTKATDTKDRFARAKKNEDDTLSSMEIMLGKLPTNEETKPYLPDGFEKAYGTDLANGLEIEQSYGNKYVWVVVPKTIEVYKTAGLEINNFDNDAYNKIENDLHLYTKDYRVDNFNDTWSSTENLGLDENEYNSLKKEMLKSVYQNGGFWIGKYEAGNKTATDNNIIRKRATENLDEAVESKNEIPYNYVTCKEAEQLAKGFSANTSKYETSLLFGVQWDLTMKYIEKSGCSVEKINTNSTEWGNYNNSKYDVFEGKYTADGKTWQPIVEKLSIDNCHTSLSTGATDRNSKQNIYELAGNAWEWTLEYNSDGPSVARGGSCGCSGIDYPASGHIAASGKHDGVGFRVAMYLK